MSHRQKLLTFLSVIILATFFGYRLFHSTGAHADEATVDSTIISADSTHPTQTFTIDSRARSIASAFALAGIEYHPEYHILSAFPQPELGLGTTITFQKPPTVTIRDGKHSVLVRTWQSTVGQVLAEQHINLGNDDKISQSTTANFISDTPIVITRVARTNQSEFEIIPAQTIKKNSDSVYRGETKIAQVAQDGKKEMVHLLIRQDGDLVSDTIIATNIVTPVQDQIILIGTKLKIDSSKTRVGTASFYGGPTKIASHYLPVGTHVLITNTKNGQRYEGIVDDYMENSSRVVDLRTDIWATLATANDSGLIVATIKVEVVLN